MNGNGRKNEGEKLRDPLQRHCYPSWKNSIFLGSGAGFLQYSALWNCGQEKLELPREPQAEFHEFELRAQLPAAMVGLKMCPTGSKNWDLLSSCGNVGLGFRAPSPEQNHSCLNCSTTQVFNK